MHKEAKSDWGAMKIMEKAHRLRRCILEHRGRLLEIAEAILESHPYTFPHLSQSPDHLQDYLQLHDQTKLDPFYFWQLVRYFGQSIHKLPINEKLKAELLINEINQKDSENSRMFLLSRRGLVDENYNLLPLAKEMVQLEKLADVIERGTSSTAREEFGREIVKASEILTDPKEISIAQWFENRATSLKIRHNLFQNRSAWSSVGLT